MKDLNEIISKLNVNDEVEITISIYGQNIKLRGVVVTVNNHNITIMQNGSTSQTVPLEQISDISIFESSGKSSKSQTRYVGYIEISKKYNVHQFKIKNSDYDTNVVLRNFFEFCMELLIKICPAYSKIVNSDEIFQLNLSISVWLQLNPDLNRNVLMKKELRKLIRYSDLNRTEKIIYYKLQRSFMVIQELLFCNQNLSHLESQIKELETSQGISDKFIDYYNRSLDEYKFTLSLIEFYKNKNTVIILKRNLNYIVSFFSDLLFHNLKNCNTDASGNNQPYISFCLYYSLCKEAIIDETGILKKFSVDFNYFDSVTTINLVNQDLFMRASYLSSFLSYSNVDKQDFVIDFIQLNTNEKINRELTSPDINQKLEEIISTRQNIRIPLYDSKSEAIQNRIQKLYYTALIFAPYRPEFLFSKQVETELFKFIGGDIKTHFNKFKKSTYDFHAKLILISHDGYGLEESFSLKHVKSLITIIKNHTIPTVFISDSTENCLLNFLENFQRVHDSDIKIPFNKRLQILKNLKIDCDINCHSPFSIIDIKTLNTLNRLYSYERFINIQASSAPDESNTFFEREKISESLFISYFLYRHKSKPNIIINSSDLSFSDVSGTLYIPVSISNEYFCQDLKIYGIRIEDFQNTKHTLLFDKSATITDGHSYNFICRIPLDFIKEIPSPQKLTFTILYTNVSYSLYNKEFSTSFSIQNLNQCNSNLIHNEFQNYRSGSVVQDDSMFFGREKDLQSIIDNIRTPSGKLITNRCFCIYGQTRTGKSSLLYHLKKQLKETPNNVIIDFGDVGTLEINSSTDFRLALLMEICNVLEYDHPELADILEKANFKLDIDLEAFNKSPSVYFDSYLKQIRRIFNSKSPDTQFIIMIDEFTYIYDWIKMEKLDSEFMKFWKGLIQNYEICAILVGQDHMMKFINDPRFTNCFGAIKTHEVTYLRPNDARLLVTVPVSREKCGDNCCTYSIDAVEYLVNVTSGSAYLLMNVCADFIDYMNEINSQHAKLAHVQDFLNDYIKTIEERHFEPLFNDKTELDSLAVVNDNKRLLSMIAHATEHEKSVLPDKLKLSDKDIERIEILKDRHVLDKDSSGYHITVELYAMWLRTMTENK